jgi:eukaryotic-like serine/threonine-protein kinase
MSLAPGSRLGPYEIVSAVGAGGMGEVYKARDTRLDRTVAIKVLPPHALDDPDLRTRFEREARAAAALDHPNICALYDVGRDAGVDYLVLRYLDGETLAARLRRGPLPLAEALRHAAEIAGALDKAHRAGIVHRDIKPGNVMLVKAPGREVSATLLDFGLAKSVAVVTAGTALDAAATMTSPLTGRATVVGTLPYMSPEQLEGRELDARSDIFSFGALLYEMITGRRAFDGASEASVIGAILERDPPSMASSLAPPALDRIVRRCLAKDRERRRQSAGDLADELSWIAESSGVQHPEAAARRSSAPLYAVSALAAVSVLGLAGLGLVLVSAK